MSRTVHCQKGVVLDEVLPPSQRHRVSVNGVARGTAIGRRTYDGYVLYWTVRLDRGETITATPSLVRAIEDAPAGNVVPFPPRARQMTLDMGAPA